MSDYLSPLEQVITYGVWKEFAKLADQEPDVYDQHCPENLEGRTHALIVQTMFLSGNWVKLQLYFSLPGSWPPHDINGPCYHFVMDRVACVEACREISLL